MLLEQHATSSALGKARKYLSTPDGENKYQKLKLNIRILPREIVHYHLGLKYFGNTLHRLEIEATVPRFRHHSSLSAL